MAKAEEKEESARNSVLREYSGATLEKIASLLHEFIPGVTPNKITSLGLIGVLTLCWKTLQKDKSSELEMEQAIKLVVTYFAISATDALDGALARYLISKGHEHNSDVGQLVDTVSDRLQEFSSSILGLLRASYHEDDLWMISSGLMALTNPLSSLSRAIVEANGLVVPENGKGFIELFGTRLGRFLLLSVNFMPRKEIVSGVSIQAAVATLVATANIKTTFSRINILVENSENESDQTEVKGKTVSQAEVRTLVLGVTTFLTTITALLLIRKVREK